jgi:3-oxoacyl-[acyl-carrier protein] reductase
LITGGSKGIGRAIAIHLSEVMHLHILINFASDVEAAKAVLAEIEANGGTAELLPFKVEDKAVVQKCIGDWQAANPDKFISILVNNAGITKDGLFVFMPESDWDDVVSVSLKGMYNVTQPIIRQMLLKRRGRIINIASLSGLKGQAGQSNYAAAKAGLIGATKALALEVAKRKITVNAVAPGFIQTDMLKDVPVDQFMKFIPMERLGKPEEVAALVAFLASDHAAYITGEVISINGGLYT